LLEIDEPRGRSAVGLVQSGLQNPFSHRRRGRVERLAVAVRAGDRPTTLRVTSRDGRPLVGCRVYSQVGGAPAAMIGETDAGGSLVVPAHDGRLQMLTAATRFVPLAQLPIVAGSVDIVTATTTGEPELLDAEERLVAWQAKLLDMIVQRRVLLAVADRQIEQADRAAAESTLARLDRGAKPTERLAELESLRRRYVRGSIDGDRRIAALIDDAAEAAKALDDAETVVDVRRRVAQMK